MFASKVIDRLLEVVDEEPVFDINKLAFDQTYLSETAHTIFSEVIKSWKRNKNMWF